MGGKVAGSEIPVNLALHKCDIAPRRRSAAYETMRAISRSARLIHPDMQCGNFLFEP